MNLLLNSFAHAGIYKMTILKYEEGGKVVNKMVLNSKK
jgi:hypothetical protein